MNCWTLSWYSKSWRISCWCEKNLTHLASKCCEYKKKVSFFFFFSCLLANLGLESRCLDSQCILYTNLHIGRIKVTGHEWKHDCIILTWNMDGTRWVTGAVVMKFSQGCSKLHWKPFRKPCNWLPCSLVFWFKWWFLISVCPKVQCVLSHLGYLLKICQGRANVKAIHRPHWESLVQILFKDPFWAKMLCLHRAREKF